MITESKPRIASIDLLRGIVMLLMALDHVRDYFHYDSFYFEPTNIDQTYPMMFFTRFITHYCAPVFIFLAGTSAYFVGRRLSKSELSSWLVKRGLWLIFLEFTVVKLAWYFTLDFTLLDAMVIWALGVCMILLGGFIHLPKKPMIILCLLAILGHNLLDGLSFENEFLNNLLIVLHQFAPIDLGPIVFFNSYPIIPWIFVMPLGYYFGGLYNADFPAERRKKLLLRIGIGMVAGFILLRGSNIYGDLYPWVQVESFTYSLLSFLNVHKYPPSLLYLMITLGPALIFLSLAENLKDGIWSKIATIGKVPMFYYLLHLYIIHGLACIAAGLTGYGFTSMILYGWITEIPELRGYGFSLGVVYMVWMAVVLMLYPLCSRYDQYKSNNRDKWWLSYL